MVAIGASALEVETEDAFVLTLLDGNRDSPSVQWSPLTLLATEMENKETDTDTDTETEGISSMLRGGSSSKRATDALQFPPLPPIHPHHTGSVHYSSVMNPNGITTYRRDITAPCDYGMLVFNIGPAPDNMPYKYDVYGDAYLWSDNGSLCLLYPSYTGYQISAKAPFWKLGYDPMTVNFGDLSSDFRRMHRISSRVLVPADGSARKNAGAIDKNRAGDYIIMGHYNFYSIDYYKQLKHFVNAWGMEQEIETDTITVTNEPIANTASSTIFNTATSKTAATTI